MRFPFRACNIFASFANLIPLLLPALSLAGPFLLSPSGLWWFSLLSCGFKILALILSCYLIGLLFNMHSCLHLNNLPGCYSFFKALPLYSYSYAYTLKPPRLLCSTSATSITYNIILSVFLLAEHLPNLPFCSLGLRAPQQISSVLLHCSSRNCISAPPGLPCLALQSWFMPARRIT